MNGSEQFDKRLLKSFGQAILEIYRLAEKADHSQFQEQALEIIQNTLAFDKAWWGLVSGLEIHSAHRFHLPEGYRHQWNQVKNNDPIAQAALGAPFEAVCFNQSDLAQYGEISEFLKSYDIAHVLCIVAQQIGLDHYAFLSLYKSSSPFSKGDQMLCEAIIPHLVEAHHRSWQRHLELERHNGRRQTVYSAICDAQGLILSTDPHLHAFLSLEWPSWSGPILPTEILKTLKASQLYKGRKLQCKAQAARGLWLLEFSVLDYISDLTPREADVAHKFASGMDYKSLARALDLSPATVRHYLRIVYAKLHIKNKAELVRALGL